MTRTIHGIPFVIHSPSCLELVTHDDVGDPGATVVIRFNGFKWWLEYCHGNGHKITRCFPSRDAAIELIASRRAA